jgi:hypothetical protein
MSTEAKFQTGDRVENKKTKRAGFVKRQKGVGAYVVSVQGFGEAIWKEEEMLKSEESKSKVNHTWNRSAS